MLGACDTSLYTPTRTHHLQEVEPDVEGKAKAVIKAQKKRKSKAAVEDQVEGCGEPSTEPGPKRSRRASMMYDEHLGPYLAWAPDELFIIEGLIGATRH